MKMNERCWLLFEKSEKTRISKGIEGYRDRTGECYFFDSLVPNHKRLKKCDIVILRKENEILGFGQIREITQRESIKKHRRCPKCNSTDIRIRNRKSPEWKCGKCSFEFSEPKYSSTKVHSFEASIDGFTRLNNPPTVETVKACAKTGQGTLSQLSILQLDLDKVRTVLDGVDISPSFGESNRRSIGQGLGLSHEERKAVEKYAMHLARKLYEDDGWEVIDTSKSNPFDFLASKGQQCRFIEVKGTTGEGQSIILTHSEVAHVNSHKNESALVVVSNIQLVKSNEEWIASEGAISTHSYPWIIMESNLQPTQFRYEVQ